MIHVALMSPQLIAVEPLHAGLRIGLGDDAGVTESGNLALARRFVFDDVVSNEEVEIAADGGRVPVESPREIPDRFGFASTNGLAEFLTLLGEQGCGRLPVDDVDIADPRRGEAPGDGRPVRRVLVRALLRGHRGVDVRQQR